MAEVIRFSAGAMADFRSSVRPQAIKVVFRRRRWPPFLGTSRLKNPGDYRGNHARFVVWSFIYLRRPLEEHYRPAGPTMNFHGPVDSLRSC